MPDGIPSEVDYDKIQGNGGWSLEPESEDEFEIESEDEFELESEESEPEYEGFEPEDRKVLQSLSLTIGKNEYNYTSAVQNKTYVAENGELIKVSGDYINRDFQSFRHPYLSTRAYSNTIIKDFHLIATLLLGSNLGSILQLV